MRKFLPAKTAQRLRDYERLRAEEKRRAKEAPLAGLEHLGLDAARPLPAPLSPAAAAIDESARDVSDRADLARRVR